jgi:transcription elongation factor Elf1
MKFRDPQNCQCTSCDVESALPVRDLLALTARCPNCGASFRDAGMRMRRKIDEVNTFVDAVRILMHVGEQLGITIEDETVEAIRPWIDLTLHDLATAANRSNLSNAPAQCDHAVRLAVRAIFPKAPETLDFAAPLLDAISQRRNKEGS